MSCLNMRLPTARKAWWRSLTSKLQTKLHKLNKTRAIRKPRIQRPKTAASRPYKFLGARFKRSRRSGLGKQLAKHHLVLIQSRCHHVLQKSHAPVAVVKLFKASAEMVDDGHPIFDQAPKLPGTSKEAGNGAERAPHAAADDMWEAMGFASPQMHRIDERAEQFIAKFRAEMEDQEMLARDL